MRIDSTHASRRSSTSVPMRVLVLACSLLFALVGLSACSSSSDGAAEESTTTIEVEGTETSLAHNDAGATTGTVAQGGAAAGGGAGAGGGGGAQGGGAAPSPQLPEQVIVPGIFNMSRAAAEQLLRDRGLVPDPIQMDNWVEHMLPAGQVTSQTPLAGLSVPRGNLVVFYVSEGPKEVVVPTVVGMCEDDARNTLRLAGFSMRAFEVPSGLPYRKVVAQDPVGPPALIQGTIVSVDVSNNQAQQCF